MGSSLSGRLKDLSEKLNKDQKIETSKSFEKEIDTLEVDLNEQCIKLLAIHRPAASDLRLVISSSRIVNDLESIGDEIERFTNAFGRMQANLNPKEEVEMEDIRRLLLEQAELLNDFLEAFEQDDVEKTAASILKSMSLEEEYFNVIRSRLAKLVEEPSGLKSMIHSFWMLRSLERINKCSRQIGAHVVFFRTGVDVRHKNHEYIKEKFLS